MTQEVKDFFSTYSDFVAKVTSEPSMDLDALKISFDDIENNNDNVFYGRLIYTLLLNQNSILRFSTSGYFTEHTE